MISATIVGRLGRDPETRTVSGTTVTNASVAVDHGWGDRKSTTWVRIAVWGKRGEALAQHLSKGDAIEASGEIYTREHDGKTYVEMDCHAWAFVPRSTSGDDRGHSTDTGRPAADSLVGIEAEVPF